MCTLENKSLHLYFCCRVTRKKAQQIYKNAKESDPIYCGHLAAIRRRGLKFYFINAVQFQR